MILWSTTIRNWHIVSLWDLWRWSKRKLLLWILSFRVKCRLHHVSIKAHRMRTICHLIHWSSHWLHWCSKGIHIAWLLTEGHMRIEGWCCYIIMLKLILLLILHWYETSHRHHFISHHLWICHIYLIRGCHWHLCQCYNVIFRFGNNITDWNRISKQIKPPLLEGVIKILYVMLWWAKHAWYRASYPLKRATSFIIQCIKSHHWSSGATPLLIPLQPLLLMVIKRKF